MHQHSRRSSNRPESAADEALNQLCELAHQRASGLGHALSHWTPPPDEEEFALRAYCKRCKRTVYVRAEHGLEGIAGSAAREPCESAHV
jgi:hypothetical protein